MAEARDQEGRKELIFLAVKGRSEKATEERVRRRGENSRGNSRKETTFIEKARENKTVLQGITEISS